MITINNDNLIRNYVRLLLKRRVVVSILLALITIFAAINASKVTFDASIEIWFLKDDEDLLIYQDFLDQFEADEIALVGIFAEDIFHPDVLNEIDRVTKSLQDTPNVRRVTSLTTIKVLRKNDEELTFLPLLSLFPISIEQADAAKQEVINNQLIRRSLVAEDGSATAVVVEVEHAANDFKSKVQLVQEMQRITSESKSTSITFRLAGIPVLDEAFFNYSKRDFLLYLPLAVLLVLILTYLIFHRLSAVMLPLTVVGITLIWVFGIMGAIGLKITVVTTALGVLVLAVGVADTVHVLSEYYERLSKGEERSEAIENSICRLFAPCFFTSATTAVGFLALLSSDLVPIKEFGVLAAVGVLSAFILTLIYLPIALSFASKPDAIYLSKRNNDIIGRIVAQMTRFPDAKPWLIIVISAGIFGVSVLGITKLQIGANPLNYFPESAQVRQDTIAVDEALGGSASLEFLVRAKDGKLTEPAVLKQLEAFQQWLEGDNRFSHSLSIVDTLKEMNRIVHGGDVIYSEIPNSQINIDLYMLLTESEQDINALISDNYEVARISARGKLSDGHRLASERPKIEAKSAAMFADNNIDVQMTGIVKLINSMEKYLLNSQIRSFVIAFILITLLMFLLLGSVPMGLFSMVPNLLPVFIALGGMGLAGIALDPGTVMISCIALGLVVDDTVHFLVRLQRERSDNQSLQEAIKRTIVGVGRPIVSTSIALAGGFMVLIFGSFSPNINFGIVSAAIVMLALSADLILLPALLLIIRPKLSQTVA